MIRVTSDILELLGTRDTGNYTPWLRTANRVVVGVGLAFSTSALIMRIYTKARVMKKFWWDDGL
ncbi:hypothetical protein N7520_004999 [Penicillium odoratum]|uniref:uncharacterized protein n=1 Tax=Penicillium odoratum TaxID=1167516 RepID=UPI0025494718|nr:uncharacterized protein N7520_004999 [Penicillium odoratum]KAJ5765440.1 hypothetical protein N7520_004999 [Penicillium odoratum]